LTPNPKKPQVFSSPSGDHRGRGRGGGKIILLTLALLLPVAIFVFLKMFGRNEFQVPPLFEHGAIAAPENCNFTYSSPYVVADSVITNLRLNRVDSLYVLYFDPSLKAVMDRVGEEFKWAHVTIVAPSAFGNKADLRLLKECVLLMKPPASVALLDQKNRIRGHYDGSDRDEVDRLAVEMKIMLKKY
jgi:hypothetical protein